MWSVSLQILGHLANTSVGALGLAFIAFAVLAILRTRHAAARHAVWSAALAGMLALPVLAPLVPPLAVKAIQRPAAAGSLVRLNRQTYAPLSSRVSPPSRPLAPVAPAWPIVLAGIYLAGVLSLLVRMLLAYRTCRRLIRRSELICDASAQDLLADLAAAQSMLWPLPQLRSSRSVIVPLTVGSREPVILLPDSWRSWDGWKLRAVLAHELAHIHRRDWLITVAASVNRCLFWFHPLAWWLERQVSALAEQASDDEALGHVSDAPRYARTVLEFAAALEGGRRLTYGVAMARTPRVSRRIDRILALQPGPGVMKRSTWVAIAACALPLVYSAAALQVAQPTSGPAVHPDLAQLFTEGSTLSPAQAKQLEEQLVRDPEDLAARGKLLSYYERPHLEHIYWLIEHHPESELAIVFSQWQLHEPADYERGKTLWLQQVAAHLNDGRILANAAQFMGSNLFAEKDLLEQAHQADPWNPEWTKRLADLFSRAISFWLAAPTSPSANPRFAMAAKAQLETSGDATLVGTVGEFLSGGPGPPPGPAQLEFAEHLLTRAQSLNPDNAEWSAALGRLHAQRENAPSNGAKRIRVGGQVQQSNLLQSVDPVYPPLAKQARIQGVVRFNVVINKDGHVSSVTLISGHPLLVTAAQDAVKQWVYRPTLLNGDPVDVATVVDVQFTLTD